MDGATTGESSQANAQSPHSSPEGAGNQARATTQQGTLVDEAARVAATLNDKLPTLSQETRLPGQNHRGATEAAREARAHDDVEKASSDAHAAHDAVPASGHTARTASVSSDREEAAATTPVAPTDVRGGRMRQRAASVGASVGGNLRPRVEKLREASTVVFDEASDDPGLRFVIIAALLFLLFLFILLFSYILG
jgi:hypothetical protein